MPSVAPEILEPIGSKLGVPGRVLNVLMTEVMLQRPYVVRAVTPGEFKYPALVGEDMYEPETSGRTAIGKLKVSVR